MLRPLRTFCAILALSLAARVAAGQISEFENRPIADIQFSDPQALTPGDTAKAAPLRKGEPLRAEDVAAAIDGLFATGRFSDVVAEAERSGNGVIIRFVTKPAWFVGGVSVSGKVNNPPDRAQISAATRFTLGAPFHQEDLDAAVSAVKSLFEANGLYEAEIVPELTRDADAQQIFIDVEVKSRKRAKYAMPVITGASAQAPLAQGSADRLIGATPAPSTGAMLSDAAIVRIAGWRIPLIHWWRQVTDSRTRRGVQKILSKYESKDRLMATVDVSRLDYDAQRRRVHPVLEIAPGPKVQVKSVETKVSQRVLKRYVPVFQQHAVDNDLLVLGKRHLTSYFQSKGFYDVDVDIRTSEPEPDLEKIEYVISRGQRYKLERIFFTGASEFDEETLRERMFMQPASFLLGHGRYSDLFRRKDEEAIATLYRSNGFRDVKVSSTVNRTYRGKAGRVAVTMHIDSGPRWVVDQVRFDGFTVFGKDELQRHISAAPGEPFAEVILASDRNAMLTMYFERGYPAADIKPTWASSGQPHHVTVTYTATEGNPQFVRDVLISGLRTTRPALVNKYTKWSPGSPLSPVRQTEIQKRLYDLGVFARVDTAIQNPDGDADHKYVLYNFEEANRYTLDLGFGAQVGRFGTPSSNSLGSPSGSTGFSPEVSVDVSRINFLGRGHSIALRTSYSSLDKHAALDYLVPRFRDIQGRNLTFTLLYDKALNVLTFSSRREEANVRMSQQFSKTLNATLRLAYRRVSVSDVVIPTLLIPELLQPVRLGLVGASFEQDRRDDKADPRKGIYNTADFQLADRVFGGQRNFARLLLRNATYHPLRRKLILARQTQIGIIKPFSAPAGFTQQELVPLPERFFAGGADSLRAFPYNQAGPRDVGAPLTPGGPASQPTGFPLGGNALFINNVELRFPLLGPNIQGVAFHDMGNVFTSLSAMSFRVHQRNEQDFNYMVHAVGFGLRYRTPVGPVRVDLAYSINPPSFIGFSGTPQQLLQCNPSLPPSGACTGVSQSVSHFQFFFSIGQAF